jgi:hypothetical protein
LPTQYQPAAIRFNREILGIEPLGSSASTTISLSVSSRSIEGFVSSEKAENRPRPFCVSELERLNLCSRRFIAS